MQSHKDPDWCESRPISKAKHTVTCRSEDQRWPWSTRSLARQGLPCPLQKPLRSEASHGMTLIYMAGGPGNRIPFCMCGWTHLVTTLGFIFIMRDVVSHILLGTSLEKTASCMQVLETRYFSISGAIISKAEFPNYFEVMIRLFWDDKPPWKSYRDSSLALGQS